MREIPGYTQAEKSGEGFQGCPHVNVTKNKVVNLVLILLYYTHPWGSVGSPKGQVHPS